MKNRTIEELHDKYVGYKKFAKIVDLLIEDGYKITNIKEYNEKFKFNIDEYLFEYSKDWNMSSKKFVDYLLSMLEIKRALNKLAKED